MSDGPPTTSTHDLERILGRVLLIGSTLSTIVLAVGLTLAVLWPAHAAGAWLLRAGLVILMATPALRVLVSVFEYASRRDWLFAGLTATVLLVLAGSLLVALH
ncbi:MAG: DUF1634 domain-containing protein [Acidobacteria bacterium]|nr:DUF1634 domain-containing protein [Acidobacteriota bacterium]